jgi:hypothetical protein
MGVFDNLKDEFNIEEAETKVNSVIASANEKMAEVREGIVSQKYNIEDKEYIKAELQDLIASDREVMESLRDMIVNGAGTPNMYAVYATLSKSVRENVSQLKELSKDVTNYQVIESNEEFREKALASKERLAEKRLAGKGQQEKVPGQITQNNTYIFNPKEQYEIMKKLEIPAVPVEEPKFDLS